MRTFKEFFQEGVADVDQIKRKRLIDRTPREIAALNAAKANKPPQGKVEVHLMHTDGSISKDKFKLTKSPAKWEDEAKVIADGHLKHMQSIYKQFPDLVKDKPTPESVHKIVIK